MRLAILTCILGDFDTPVDPVDQLIPDGWDVDFHRWTDEDFPPIKGLTPRLQYRIPKYFGWEMHPDFDFYIWLDGSVTFLRSDCVKWWLEQLGNNDIALFAHPDRSTIKDEVQYIDDRLHRRVGKKAGQDYIIERYGGGLHEDYLIKVLSDRHYQDDKLYASTAFIYRNSPRVQAMMHDWWFDQSRYYTCDQVHLPYVLDKWGCKVKVLDEPIYKSGYLSLVSHHK